MMVDLVQLLDEAEATPVEGWDFTRLGERLVVEPPPWDFDQIVAERARSAATMLDMGTGGGEWLSSLPRRAPLTVATESWPPNVGVAATRLRVHGIAVVQDEGAVDNHRQDPKHPRGRLAFRTGTFDLVANRHESFAAGEVARVLRPGGTFITQQTRSGSQQLYRPLGVPAPPVEHFELDLAVEQLEDAGLRIEQADTGVATIVFADVGALAWYLRCVPWAVPGFTVATYRDALINLRGKPIRLTLERFWVSAHK